MVRIVRNELPGRPVVNAAPGDLSAGVFYLYPEAFRKTGRSGSGKDATFR